MHALLLNVAYVVLNAGGHKQMSSILADQHPTPPTAIIFNFISGGPPGGGGGGGLRGLSQLIQTWSVLWCAHGAQTNFEDLTP